MSRTEWGLIGLAVLCVIAIPAIILCQLAKYIAWRVRNADETDS